MRATLRRHRDRAAKAPEHFDRRPLRILITAPARQLLSTRRNTSASADNSMTVILEGGCRVSNPREGEPISNGTLRIWNQIGRATGAQAISLRIMEFVPGLSPGIQNGECDEILYLIDWRSGLGRADRDEVSTARSSGWVNVVIDGRPHEVDADTGIYLRPGETFAVDNPEPDSITLISSQCPDPDHSPKFVPPLTVSDSIPPARSPIVRLADRPAQPTGDRWYRVLIDDEVGSTQAT